MSRNKKEGEREEKDRKGVPRVMISLVLSEQSAAHLGTGVLPRQFFDGLCQGALVTSNGCYIGAKAWRDRRVT